MEVHNTYKQMVHMNARTEHLHIMPLSCPQCLHTWISDNINTAFCYVIQCSQVEDYPCFAGPCCFHVYLQTCMMEQEFPLKQWFLTGLIPCSPLRVC